jgi:hypothetical protein
MYKLTIEVLNNNYKTSLRNSTKYFLNSDELRSYLLKTFPYHKYPKYFIMGDYYASSFNVVKDDIALYSIEIEYVELYQEPEIKSLAFGEDSSSIYEIFGEDSQLIELEFLKYMDIMIDREECADSWRIGLLDSKDSMDEYWTYKTCCGSDDTEIEINGKHYMFGCNYGH